MSHECDDEKKEAQDRLRREGGACYTDTCQSSFPKFFASFPPPVLRDGTGSFLYSEGPVLATRVDDLYHAARFALSHSEANTCLVHVSVFGGWPTSCFGCSCHLLKLKGLGKVALVTVKWSITSLL